MGISYWYNVYILFTPHLLHLFILKLRRLNQSESHAICLYIVKMITIILDSLFSGFELSEIITAIKGSRLSL